ncbi:MAG: bifunctional diaminohydroxyphosphoribosylaminopyrimidine deaminase/5-amino-6-(5-phosphoribosylamino)uracil reductase RibD [Myxococcales bacterium]|nr:bifunctional diaminohydroxyphosphoribosylaminopyrimidine deaminase/5-amino-6-(5-phosphoribosylamino)uracil reductase RibD [Myxococcales bacterium]
MVVAGPADSDSRYMAIAVREAMRGIGFTSPNPAVGCVLVRDGRILATGYHRAAGGDHAEVAALRSIGFAASGSCAYVTLEPCNHTGKTGPCTEALKAAGVVRVVIGVQDPHGIVNGAGIDRLRSAGIEVVVGVLQSSCEALIAPFRRVVTTGFPYLTLKVAASFDGRVADVGGRPVWLTGQDAQFAVAELRHRADAILVGVGTVLSDDPRLTTRRREGRLGKNPRRIVVDSHLRTPTNARVLDGGATIFTTISQDSDLVRRFVDRGNEVISVPCDATGRVNLEEMFRECVRRSWHHILCESGPTLTTALLFGRWIQRVAWFSAPMFGGAPHLLALPTSIGVGTMYEGPHIVDVAVQRIGKDVVCIGDVFYPE